MRGAGSGLGTKLLRYALFFVALLGVGSALTVSVQGSGRSSYAPFMLGFVTPLQAPLLYADEDLENSRNAHGTVP